MTCFVDFIRIKQRHAGVFDAETLEMKPALPLVDSGLVGKWGRDAETGNLNEDPEWGTASKLHIRGSFDSLVIVRCDGYTVELEGNVGRLDRPDNVFNLDWEGTLAKCNEILAGFDLPPFTPGEKDLNLNPSEYDYKHGNCGYWTGASVSEIHLTRNYHTGSMANAQCAIDWLSTQSLKNIKRGKGGPTSVVWGSKKGRKLITAYLKAPEMLAPGHKHGRKTETIKNDPVYQYCTQSGLLRLELKAQRLMLRDKDLRFIGDITMGKLIQLFDSEIDPLLNRTREDITRLDLDAIPSPFCMTAAAFLRGENVKTLLSNGSFYRHAKKLREYGIDIAEPLASLQKFTSVIKVVELTAAIQPPRWYWNHQQQLSTVQAANDYSTTFAAIDAYEPQLMMAN
ncbi:phage/plasmid replication protein [Craterilacuibacter sp. RT1T]|uniref:phage/plasmid replication domain-containing protein n=1 Tax=Craterilacuibacter sp. RT1T TaxID=2942211 RepID=UPI0020C07A92|nr:phage/plasmid replication protein [Craterilacuibacter sp. RT1T]MCL6263162.1 phage/plasmid replication protein [Craterilacuibacter sp. RT1T]